MIVSRADNWASSPASLRAHAGQYDALSGFARIPQLRANWSAKANALRQQADELERLSAGARQ